MREVHLACAADAAYAPHSAAMLHSVLANTHEARVHVHYLHGPGLPPRVLRKLGAMVERAGGAFTAHLVDDGDIDGLPGWGHISTTMWYRVFLPELLPQADAVLYLDCDIVAAGPLDELWATDLDGNHVGAVTNLLEPWARDRPAKLGLPPGQPYFNSGVVLMNLELMRRDRSSSALREYGRDHSAELLWPDQDTLNVVLGGRRLALHPRWNCMNSVVQFAWAPDVLGADAVAEARTDPRLRHFEGPGANKPWHRLCAMPHRELYFEHRRATPWPRVRLDGAPGLRDRLRGFATSSGAPRP